MGLDRSGEVWLYLPGSDCGREGRHKTAHKGKARVVATGPKARAVLAPFLDRDPGAFCFSPREASAAVTAARRAAQKTKLWPSHAPRYRREAARRKANPKKPRGSRYFQWSYGQAIDRACDKAGVPRFAPNQLRHTFATEARRRFGVRGRPGPARAREARHHPDLRRAGSGAGGEGGRGDGLSRRREAGRG
jgi:integrase